MHYDAIVVGSGPAGSVAAHECARAGMRVGLFEKQRLPRHKTCGGGMPVTVQNHVRELSPESFVESDVRYMRHTWRFGEPVLGEINPAGSAPQISLWMVQRSVFDHALACRAAGAGAHLRDGVAVRHVELEGSRLRVRTDSTGREEAHTADYVIGADGANGMVARSAGLRRERVLAIALEVEHPFDWSVPAHPDLRPEVCHLEYGAVPRGYAWVFPKRDHLNVGAGVFRPRGDGGRGDATVRPMLQQAICRYMDCLGIPYRAGDLRYHAHPLPLWNGREKLDALDGRILLAGDAAGLVNPFFGDGILHAIKSGEIAGRCAAGGEGREYTRRVHDEFASNFDAALKLARFFYQWPSLCYHHAVRKENATRAAARLLAGDAVFADVAGRVLKRLRRSVAAER